MRWLPHIALFVGLSMALSCAPSPTPTPAATPPPIPTPTPTATPGPLPTAPPAPTATPRPAPKPGTGTVEIRVTDAPPPGVTRVLVTARNFQVHRAGVAEGSGWETVIPGEKSFDLVANNGLDKSMMVVYGR